MKLKRIPIGKEEVKLSLFADEVILLIYIYIYIYTMKVIEGLQAFLDINWKGTQGGDLFILMYLIHNFP